MIADKVAEYAGHPIAIVAADTYDHAFQSAKLVKVDYEELEPVLTIKEAIKKGAIAIISNEFIRNLSITQFLVDDINKDTVNFEY